MTSCRKKQTIDFNTIEMPASKSNHKWYYFSDNSYSQIDRPQNAPTSVAKPWTEAVRISSAVMENRNDYQMAKGFATVNRCGMLVFNGSEITLCNDNSIFTSRTAGNTVFTQSVPIFSVYRSTFFNDAKSPYHAEHTFLVSFNPEQNIFYPLINIENLGLDPEDEITDFIFDGHYWTCSVKKTENDKISFSYLTFQPKENISLITPYNASDMLHISEVDVSDFRNAKKPKNFSKAPERLKSLLHTIPDNIDFYVSVYSSEGHSPRNFIKSRNNDSELEELTAKAMITENWIGCLFNDGTFYLNGALFERPLMNGGKTFGIRLPKLPSNFVYGDFVISGTMLYASWEETSFYETKRSGFINVNLDEILYKK